MGKPQQTPGTKAVFVNSTLPPINKQPNSHSKETTQLYRWWQLRYIWENHPENCIFFRWVGSTTNQFCVSTLPKINIKSPDFCLGDNFLSFLGQAWCIHAAKWTWILKLNHPIFQGETSSSSIFWVSKMWRFSRYIYFFKAKWLSTRELSVLSYDPPKNPHEKRLRLDPRPFSCAKPWRLPTMMPNSWYRTDTRGFDGDGIHPSRKFPPP